MNFLVTFIILSIINVVFSTIRSITTIKSGKTIASLISGGYFAFYNIMLIYTVANFPMWEKCLITFCCNVAGVWIVKFFEDKMRKDKLWKIELTTKTKNADAISKVLKNLDISFNCYGTENGKDTVFNIFCIDKKQSSAIKDLCTQFKVKYFVSETKSLI